MGQRIGGAGRWRRLGHRLFHSRVRTWSLVVLTVLCTAAAVLIGLPPQSDLPTGFGSITALPVLPDAKDPRAYSVALGWQSHNFRDPRTVLYTDTFWSDSGSFDSEAGLPVYLVVSDDMLADLLLACAGGSTGHLHLTEVSELPAAQKRLLETFARGRSAGLSASGRLLRLDDVSTKDTHDYPFATCEVPSERIFTQDEVELHMRAPSITVVTAMPTASRSKDRLTPYVTIGLPPGWAPQDARAIQGIRRDTETGVSWLGAEPTDPLTGERLDPEADYRVLQVGPVNLEATSMNAARRSDRKLFWSGLLVGLAGSCLLMLFESLPWRREEREVT